MLEIREASDGVPVGELDQDVLMKARDRGFRLAFGARLLQKEYSAFVPLASYIMLKMGVLELDRGASIARAIRTHTKATVCATQSTPNRNSKAFPTPESRCSKGSGTRSRLPSPTCRYNCRMRR